ncbi:MAG: hypothetical protein ACRDIY_24075 [Chloroflexota bacterium]
MDDERRTDRVDQISGVVVPYSALMPLARSAHFAPFASIRALLGAFGTTQSTLSAAGMGLASLLGSAIGTVPLLNLAGGLFVLAGLAGLVIGEG